MNNSTENIVKKGFLNKTVIFFIMLYFILKPFYLWESGLPQISDLIILLSLIIYSIKNRFIFRINTYDKTMITISIIFLVYISIINIVWFFNGLRIGFYKVYGFLYF